MNLSDKQKSIRKLKFFAGGDVAIYLASLLLIVTFTLIAFAVPKDKGDTFSVYYREECIFQGSLSDDARYLFVIENGVGEVRACQNDLLNSDYNIIVVSNGKVCVQEASCPDHTCVYQGATDWGEIICLPHNMKIVVEGEGLVTDL